MNSWYDMWYEPMLIDTPVKHKLAILVLKLLSYQGVSNGIELYFVKHFPNGVCRIYILDEDGNIMIEEHRDGSE